MSAPGKRLVFVDAFEGDRSLNGVLHPTCRQAGQRAPGLWHPLVHHHSLEASPGLLPSASSATSAQASAGWAEVCEGPARTGAWWCCWARRALSGCPAAWRGAHSSIVSVRGGGAGGADGVPLLPSYSACLLGTCSLEADGGPCGNTCGAHTRHVAPVAPSEVMLEGALVR